MGTAFGIGLPGTYPVQQTTPWGLSPFASPGIGVYPSAPQAFGPPLAQVLQSLQSTPYQLQQLLQLQYLQLQQVQQLLQVVPTQLQQLQQLIQFIPHQLQQVQQLSQQYGHGPASAIGLSMSSPFVATPSINVPFTGSSHVM